MSRFRVRATGEVLPHVKAWPNWTVLATAPDPSWPDMWFVEIDDPNAPPEAEGKLCEPVMERRVGRLPNADGELVLAPPTAVIVDYGVPVATP